MEIVITQILTVLFSVIFAAWLRWKFPASDSNPDGPGVDELQRRYRNWDAIFGLAAFLIFLSIAAAVFIPLYRLCEVRFRRMQDDPSTAVFYVDPAAYSIPSLLFSAAITAPFVLLFIKAFLKGRYSEYKRLNILRYRFDQDRFAKFLTYWMMALSISCFVAIFGTYAVISPGELRLNSFFGLERRYLYTDISEVITAPAVTAPNGKAVYRRAWILRFKDGFSFSTESIPANELNGQHLSFVMRDVVKRSGVQPIEKSIFKRGES